MAHGDRAKPSLIFAAIAVACASYSISQNLITPALPDIQHRFHTTAGGATAVLTVFFISGAVSAGVIGRIGDMFGKQRILKLQLLVLCAGACVCAVAPSLPVLLAGRLLMGTAASLIPLAFAIIRDELPPERAGRAFAIIGAILGLGAAAGLAIGGLIADTLGYEWAFWLIALATAGAFFGVAAFVPASPKTSPGKVDVLGVALLSIALAGPLIAISQIPRWGWLGWQPLLLAGGGLVVLAVFVRHERRHPAPLLDMRLLAERQIARTNAASFVIGFGIIGVSAILIQFFQEPRSTGYGLGANATHAGFILIPGCLALLAGAPVIGRLNTRAGSRITFSIGCAIASVAMAGIALEHHGTFALSFWSTLIFIGNGMTFTAMPSLILASVPINRSGEATGVNFIFRSVGSALGTQFMATLIVSAKPGSATPIESGFVHAFTAASIVCLIAFFMTLAIPGRGRLGAPIREPIVASADTAAVPGA